MDERRIELAQTFAQVARALLAEEDVGATLNRISRVAVETIQGCDHAGITLIEGRKLSTAGASDKVPVQVDAIQYESDQGPCLNAMRAHEVFLVDDLLSEGRWPEFSARAAEETGVLSMMSFRLFVEQDTMGALNLYSKTPRAFNDEAREIGSVLAAHAAVALSSARKQEQLQEALGTRDVIGQAKGILMAREDVTADEAFDMLRRGSQRLNVKLRELAERVTSQAAPDEE